MNLHLQLLRGTLAVVLLSGLGLFVAFAPKGSVDGASERVAHAAAPASVAAASALDEAVRP